MNDDDAPMVFFVAVAANDDDTSESSSGRARKRRRGRRGGNGNKDDTTKSTHGMTTRSRSGKPSGASGRSAPAKVPNPAEESYTTDEYDYVKRLPISAQNAIAEAESHVTEKADAVPRRFKLLMSDLRDDIKSIALKKCSALAYMYPGAGEYSKLSAWLDTISAVPFGTVLPIVGVEATPRDALVRVHDTLTHKVYGHDEVKQEIVNYVAQRMANPQAAGKVLCLAGPPGVAKTHLAREGISKALNLPFGMIALGGANDASFLDGHGFTYEGSRPGIIVSELIRMRCINPVLFFDELDKVSEDTRGIDVLNVLLHVTDPSQNDAFRDKYLSDAPIDLSKAFLMFSCNDVTKINPILRDRLTILHCKGYSVHDKVQIVIRHIWPELLAEFAFATHDIAIDDDTLRYVVSLIAEEQGVRGLRRALHCVLGCVNTRRMMGDDRFSDFPIAITNGIVDEFLSASFKNRDTMSESVRAMYV